MDPQDRKLRKRIARRKEKVQRLIEQRENYQRRQDCLRVLSKSRNKLHRLKQELMALEEGKLPGA